MRDHLAQTKPGDPLQTAFALDGHCLRDDNRAIAATREILTVGHSTHAGERFVDLLRVHDVQLVCDVRRFPSSRRNPQFNAGSLRDALDRAGVGYEPLGDELGGRRETNRRSGTGTGSRADAFLAYGEFMQTPQFAAALGRLEGLAAERRAAIMCAEGDWRHCHRRLIADTLAARGWRVLHIGRDGRLEEHPPALA